MIEITDFHYANLLLIEIHDSNPKQLIQVVAPKGLAISRLTTMVMPSHIGFAQLFTQGIDSVAKALWGSNRQDSIFLKKLKTSK